MSIEEIEWLNYQDFIKIAAQCQRRHAEIAVSIGKTIEEVAMYRAKGIPMRFYYDEEK